MITKETASMLLDEFACNAMQALINKSPFFDKEGEFGTKIDQEKLNEIKKGIAESAYEYGSYMLIARELSQKWISENFK